MEIESTRYGNLESILQDPNAKPCHLRLQDLKDVTNNFAKDLEIGNGGFGIVYKVITTNSRDTTPPSLHYNKNAL